MALPLWGRAIGPFSLSIQVTLMKRFFIFTFNAIFFLSWFIYFRPLVLGGPASYIIVSGISMEPTLKTGDLTILQKQDQYEPGDVIAYRADGGQVIHRVVGGDENGYETQGDNKRVTDPWRPTVNDVLGKMWFFIPGAGKILHNLRQPLGLAMLGIFGIFLFLNEPFKKSKKKRRGIRMGSISHQQDSTTITQASPTKIVRGWKIQPSDFELAKNIAVVFFFLFALVLAGTLYLGVLSFSKPISEMQTIDVVTYSHSSSYNYIVNVQPSALYPQGTVEPPGDIALTDDSTPASTNVFTRLARSVDIDFKYSLIHDQPTEFSGKLTPMLEIWDYETLLKKEPLTQPVEFSGDEVSNRVSLDFVRIQQTIAAIEQEIGYSQGSYRVIVSSTIEGSGSIGERPVDEVFAPKFTLQYGPNQITFDNQLSFSEEKSIQEEFSLPMQVSFLGMNILVNHARMWSLTIGLFSLIIVTLCAGVLFLGWCAPEADKIRIRYGNMVVNVSKTRLHDNPAVRLETFEDLARVAERTGNVICHIQQLDDGHFYFVPDTQVIFTYATGRKQQEGKVECGDS